MALKPAPARQLYDSPYIGVHTENGKFQGFQRRIGENHRRNGYWSFPHAYEARAYQAGFKSPEAVLKCQLDEDESPDDLIMRWIPGSLDTYCTPRQGNAKQHLLGIAEERQRLGRPGLRGSFTIPTYPIDLDGLLVQFRTMKHGSQVASPDPNFVTRSTPAPIEVAISQRVKLPIAKSQTPVNHTSGIPDAFLINFAFPLEDKKTESPSAYSRTSSTHIATIDRTGPPMLPAISTTEGHQAAPSNAELDQSEDSSSKQGLATAKLVEQQVPPEMKGHARMVPERRLPISLRLVRGENSDRYRSPYESTTTSFEGSPLFTQDKSLDNESAITSYTVRDEAEQADSTLFSVVQDTPNNVVPLTETFVMSNKDTEQGTGKSQSSYIGHLPPPPPRENLVGPGPSSKCLATKLQSAAEENTSSRRNPQLVLVPPTSSSGKPLLSPKPVGWYAERLAPLPPRKTLDVVTPESQTIVHAFEASQTTNEMSKEVKDSLFSSASSSQRQGAMRILQEKRNQQLEILDVPYQTTTNPLIDTSIVDEILKDMRIHPSSVDGIDSSGTIDVDMGSCRTHDFDDNQLNNINLLGECTPTSQPHDSSDQSCIVDLQNNPDTSISCLLAGPIACIDCGLEEGHRFDCHIGNIHPSKDLNALQLRWLANEVERRDPEQWREHRDPPPEPALEPEDFATKVREMAVVIRKETSYKDDPSLHSLSNETLLFTWAFKQCDNTTAEVVFFDEKEPYTIGNPPSQETAQDSDRDI